MTAADFRRIALSFESAEESSHMGAADFRVGGRIFATLAAEKQGFGNLMLSAEHQAAFVTERPDLFLPVSGGWGRNGATHIRLAAASEDILSGAPRRTERCGQNQPDQPRRRETSPERNQFVEIPRTVRISSNLFPRIDVISGNE
jgi:hypothetical protein